MQQFSFWNFNHEEHEEHEVFWRFSFMFFVVESAVTKSSTAFAAEKKAPNAVVREAAEGTIAKIEEAVSSVEQQFSFWRFSFVDFVFFVVESAIAKLG